MKRTIALMYVTTYVAYSTAMVFRVKINITMLLNLCATKKVMADIVLIKCYGFAIRAVAQENNAWWGSTTFLGMLGKNPTLDEKVR